jgi:hypothetical protein
MKRLIVTVAAVLMAMPGAAMAQDWKFSAANADNECFAMTFRGKVMLGFQANNGDHAGGIMLFAPRADVPGNGEASFAIQSSGGLNGSHTAKDASDAELAGFFMRVETMGDFDSLPDRFRLSFTRGGQKVLDTEITGFRAAWAQVRQCVARR